jgi:hypothetical protein
MRATAPFNFTTPLANLRNGLASNAMQQWMMAVLEFMGGEYKNFAPSSNAPSFVPSRYTYRLTGGDCQINADFTFSGDGSAADFYMTLPIPALAHFGQLLCYMNVLGAPTVVAPAAIFPDGNLHFSLSGAPPFPVGNIYVQMSGRYRVT